MQFKYAAGATPLSPDEIYNLKPNHLSTQKELNEWEQFNIARGENWALLKKRGDLLTIEFAKKLHFKMFDQTWSWAGTFRKVQTNIGVEAIYIPQELKMIFDDVNYWLENNVYDIRETAVRIHHRLVFVHPFPNGNGRFSRLMADLMMDFRDRPRFTWGSSSLIEDSITRQEYLKHLRNADKGDYTGLIKFADS